MSANDSVTHWLQQLGAGDRGVIEKLWQRYYPRLVQVAYSRLQQAPVLRNEAEDIALSAFENFCRGAEKSRFPQLFDRDDLWHLLVVITARKATNLVRHSLRQKRGGGRVLSLSAMPNGFHDPEGFAFAELIARDPDPQFAAQAAEEYRRLLAVLNDPVLSAVAVWKMEGYTNAEVAVKVGLSLPTVERKLSLIRKAWENEVPT